MSTTRIATAALAVALVSLSPEGQSANGPEATSDLEEMTLVVGEQHVLDAMRVKSFSESTRGVIEVKIPRDGRQLVITAVSPGRTSLLLIRRDGSRRSVPITVFARHPEEICAEIRELLADEPGVRLQRIGSRIFVDGTVGSEAALERARRVADLYPGQVSSLLQIDPNLVRTRTNIRLDLAFVELRAGDRWSAGIDWPAKIGGTQRLGGSVDLTTGAVSATYEVVDQALPAIEAAARSGWARIRKRATLITTSGNRASYHAGGEVNVAVAGSQAAELRTVPYGCELTVLPRLDTGPGILDLEVEAEVSDLAETSQQVPGRTISRVATLVHLGLGQSIVLSGLEAESESSYRQGLPLLSRIPLLGFFFGTGGADEERVEGLIAITPTVLDDLERGAKKELEKMLSRFESFDGDFAEENE